MLRQKKAEFFNEKFSILENFQFIREHFQFFEDFTHFKRLNFTPRVSKTEFTF